eukprot:gene17055-biopygen2297
MERSRVLGCVSVSFCRRRRRAGGFLTTAVQRLQRRPFVKAAPQTLAAVVGSPEYYRVRQTDACPRAEAVL